MTQYADGTQVMSVLFMTKLDAVSKQWYVS